MDYQTIQCVQCSSNQFEVKTNFKGIYGIWCLGCGRFARWLGKEKAKPNNPKFIKAHKQAANGDRVCCLCGIAESEAKIFGWDFAADHIVAEDFGGKDDVKNSWPLCSKCHYIKTSLEHCTRGIKKYLEAHYGNQESSQN